TTQQMASLSVCYSILSPFSALASDIQKTDTRHNSRGRFHQSLLAVQVAKQGKTLNEKESLPTSHLKSVNPLFRPQIIAPTSLAGTHSLVQAQHQELSG